MSGQGHCNHQTRVGHLKLVVMVTLYQLHFRRAHAELKEANEQIDLLTQTIKVKDHVVVELTNQVFQLENKGQILTE